MNIIYFTAYQGVIFHFWINIEKIKKAGKFLKNSAMRGFLALVPNEITNIGPREEKSWAK
jgi:hypothetical protein